MRKVYNIGVVGYRGREIADVAREWDIGGEI
jgi:hypothetical protein